MHRLASALLLVLALALPAMAQPPTTLAQLEGKWIYSRTAGNEVYTDTLTLKNGEKGPTGTATYTDRGKECQDLFWYFELKPDNKIFFVVKRDKGHVAQHDGKFTADGNTIRGSYNLGMGVGGRFVLYRADVDCPPSMSGKWEYHILDPSGGPGEKAVGALLGDTEGGFEGYIYYDSNPDTSVNVKGKVAKDGGLTFDIYEKKTYVNQGQLAPDQGSATGTWTEKTGVGGGHFTLTRHKN